MQSVILRRFGAADALALEEVPVPEISKGEVLVRIEASGVNYFETLMRRDRYGFTPTLPIVLGVEVAGTVMMAGAETQIPVGSRVAVPLFAIGRTGGYAQYIAVNAEAVHLIPEHLSFEAAVALLVPGLTAVHALRRTSPQGRNVLIPAAAGAVGTLLVQLARQRGAKTVYAAVGTPEKLRTAVALGADAGVLYDAAGWGKALKALTGGRGIDIIYDFVGGTGYSEYLNALEPGGEIVFGALGRAAFDRKALNQMVGQNLSLKGFSLLPLLTGGGIKDDLAELFSLATSGALEVVIGARIPLAEAAHAHALIETRQTTGKTILLPWA